MIHLPLDEVRVTGSWDIKIKAKNGDVVRRYLCKNTITGYFANRLMRAHLLGDSTPTSFYVGVFANYGSGSLFERQAIGSGNSLGVFPFTHTNSAPGNQWYERHPEANAVPEITTNRPQWIPSVSGNIVSGNELSWNLGDRWLGGTDGFMYFHGLFLVTDAPTPGEFPDSSYVVSASTHGNANERMYNAHSFTAIYTLAFNV